MISYARAIEPNHSLGHLAQDVQSGVKMHVDQAEGAELVQQESRLDDQIAFEEATGSDIDAEGEEDDGNDILVDAPADVKLIDTEDIEEDEEEEADDDDEAAVESSSSTKSESDEDDDSEESSGSDAENEWDVESDAAEGIEAETVDPNRCM